MSVIRINKWKEVVCKKCGNGSGMIVTSKSVWVLTKHVSILNVTTRTKGRLNLEWSIRTVCQTHLTFKALANSSLTHSVTTTTRLGCTRDTLCCAHITCLHAITCVSIVTICVNCAPRKDRNISVGRIRSQVNAVKWKGNMSIYSEEHSVKNEEKIYSFFAYLFTVKVKSSPLPS